MVLKKINLFPMFFKMYPKCVRINGLNKRGVELFVKRFSRRLDENEVLTTITEEVIKKANQTM